MNQLLYFDNAYHPWVSAGIQDVKGNYISTPQPTLIFVQKIVVQQQLRTFRCHTLLYRQNFYHNDPTLLPAIQDSLVLFQN